MTAPFKNRVRSVWGWFVPTWLLPLVFFFLVPIGRAIGLPLVIVLMVVLLFGGSVTAMQAKKRLSWGEFYLLWLGVPMFVLFAGLEIMVCIAHWAK